LRFPGERANMPAAMIKKLLHTRMRVDDIARTIAFYEEILGLKCVRRTTSPRGAQLAFIQTPGSAEEIELCQFPGAEPVRVQPDLMHLAFEVDDLAAFAAALEKKGCKLSDGPARTSSGDTIAFIDAPEGYEVELIEKG
jgi:lactoylglutathione lyase